MSTKTSKPQAKALLTDENGDGINHSWSVSNFAKNDLAILDLYNDGKSTKETVYEQGITRLTTADNKSTIAASSDGKTATQATITLNDKHNNILTTIYEIVFANPSNFFPVYSTAVGLTYPADPDADAYFAALSIPTAATDVMTQTANFIRTITANPSSALATSFTLAVQDATATCKSTSAIDAAMATWFKNNTTTFQDVTLEAIAAFQSYIVAFPYEWSDYSSSKLYYLYTSDGTTVTAMGTLSIAIKDASKPPSTTKDDSNFTLEHKTADGKTTTELTYYKGQFVEKANPDAPSICLQGAFMVKSLLTNVDTDTALISVMSGVVFGHKVIGSDTQQHNPDPNDPNDKWSGLYSLLHPSNALGVVTLAITLGGLCSFLKDLVIAPLKALKDAIFKKKVEKKGTDPTDTEVGQLRDQITKLKSQWQLETQAIIDKMESDVDTTREIAAEQQRFNQELVDALNEMKRQSLVDELEGDNEALVAAAEYNNNDDLQQASYEVYTEVRYIKKLAPQDLDAELPAQEGKVTQISADTKVAVDSAIDGAPAEITEAVDAGKQAAQDAADERVTLDDQRKKAEEGQAEEGKSDSDPFSGGGDDGGN